MPKEPKNYRVTIDVSGEIELTVSATSEAQAIKAARVVADGAFTEYNRGKKEWDQIEDVSEAVDFELNEDSIECEDDGAE